MNDSMNDSYNSKNVIFSICRRFLKLWTVNISMSTTTTTTIAIMTRTATTTTTITIMTMTTSLRL